MTDHPPLDFAREAHTLIERRAARALTLVERHAILVLGPSDGFTPSTPSEYGRRIAQAWRAQAPFDRSQLFTRRLALDGLDEATLLILSEADARSSEPNPDWLSAWQSAFDTSKQAAQDSTYFRIFGNDYPLLAKRDDFPETMSALREHHESLRDAGVSSGLIAHAVRQKDDAATISALATHAQPLIELGYDRLWVTELATLHGPELIGLLARHPEMTESRGGPAGVERLIYQQDGTYIGLAKLQAEIDAR